LLRLAELAIGGGTGAAPSAGTLRTLLSLHQVAKKPLAEAPPSPAAVVDAVATRSPRSRHPAKPCTRKPRETLARTRRRRRKPCNSWRPKRWHPKFGSVRESRPSLRRRGGRRNSRVNLDALKGGTCFWLHPNRVKIDAVSGLWARRPECMQGARATCAA
jgi:hypothetical protein